MTYDMKRPCPHCPFRSDIPGYLTEERAIEIADSLLADQSFPCHKTVDYSEEDEDGFSDGRVTKDSRHCAGALIMLEHMERPNQMMRICERIGMYDRHKLDMDAPVFTDTEEFIDHHAAADRRPLALAAPAREGEAG